jgi:hypothetical protein
MDADKLTSCGAGEPRQLFRVIARVDEDDGFPAAPDRKAFVIVPRETVAGDPRCPETPGAPPGGDPM